MATPDMDVIKEIPGYKVILKAVLKSQIQQLVEQLASHTDEESVILTASVSDGTLSHLGSDSGKNFLDDHEDIKSQFLGFCLKRHHRKKVQQQQQQTSPMRSQPWPTHLGQGPGPRPRTVNRPAYPRQNIQRHPLSVPSSLSKNIRHEPYPVSKPLRRSVDSNVDIVRPVSDVAGETSPVVKVEPDDSSQHSGNDGESSTAHGDNSIPNEGQGDSNQTQDSNAPHDSSDSNNTNDPQTSGGDLDPNVNVKVEAISESDMELEITGVELGNNSDPMGSQKDMWSPNTSMGYDSSGAVGSPGDVQPNYNSSTRQSKKLFTCEICGKESTTRQNSETHMRVHTGEKPFSCSICKKQFRQKCHVKSHMVIHFASTLDS